MNRYSSLRFIQELQSLTRLIKATHYLSIVYALFLFGFSSGCRKLGLHQERYSFAGTKSFYAKNEETLFLFYKLESVDKFSPLSKDSLLEFKVSESEKYHFFSDVTQVGNVHRHIKIDCGDYALCGSISIQYDQADPRLELSFRPSSKWDERAISHYLPAEIADTLIVYGVYDQENIHTQWRYRHNFPNMTHQEVYDFGLRRRFEIHELYEPLVYGWEGSLADLSNNPWHFNSYDCTRFDWKDITKVKIDNNFNDFVWSDVKGASGNFHNNIYTCALVQIPTGSGLIEANAKARENPKVESLYGALRIRTQDALHNGVVISACQESIDEQFADFQIHRLSLDSDSLQKYCLEELFTSTPQAIAAKIKSEIQLEDQLSDQILFLLLQYPDRYQIDDRIALYKKIDELIVYLEASSFLNLSPRIAGVFVYDKEARPVLSENSNPFTVWCPQVDFSGVSDSSSCAVWDSVLKKSIFTVSSLPIFPSQTSFKKFIRERGMSGLGSLSVESSLAPYRQEGSFFIPLTGQRSDDDTEKEKESEEKSEEQLRAEYLASIMPSGAVGFYEGDDITLRPNEYLSYCPDDDPYQIYMFKNEMDSQPKMLSLLPYEDDRNNRLDLKTVHLGVVWDQSFLLRYRYKHAVEAKIAIFPIYGNFRQKEYFGDQRWEIKDFDLSKVMARCEQNCQNPVFNSDGTYDVHQSFAEHYKSSCYRPAFPIYKGALYE